MKRLNSFRMFMTILIVLTAFTYIPASAWGQGFDFWTILTPMPTARQFLAAAAVNDKIYAIGGHNGSILATNEEYDRVSNTWSPVTDMPTVRYGLAVTVVNDKIYALGGRVDGSYLATNEEYDPSTDTWRVLAPMPTVRNGLAVAVVNDKIYAIGGYNGSNLATNEEYDPSTDTWRVLAPMPTARQFLATAAVNDKIYAIGGFDSSIHLATVEEYDSITNTWKTVTDMPAARYGLAVAVVNDKIYALGGYNGSNLATNEEYDPSTDTWLVGIAPMPTARRYLAAVVVNDKICAIGGFAGSSSAKNEEYTLATLPSLTLDITPIPNPTTVGGPLDILLDLENPGDGFNADFRLFAMASGNVNTLVSLSPFIPSGFMLTDFSIFSTSSVPGGLPAIVVFIAAIFDAGGGDVLDFDTEVVGIGVAPSAADINALRQTATDFLNSGDVNAAPPRPEEELNFNGKINNPFEQRVSAKGKLTTTWGRLKLGQ